MHDPGADHAAVGHVVEDLQQPGQGLGLDPGVGVEQPDELVAALQAAGDADVGAAGVAEVAAAAEHHGPMAQQGAQRRGGRGGVGVVDHDDVHVEVVRGLQRRDAGDGVVGAVVVDEHDAGAAGLVRGRAGALGSRSCGGV